MIQPPLLIFQDLPLGPDMKTDDARELKSAWCLLSSRGLATDSLCSPVPDARWIKLRFLTFAPGRSRATPLARRKTAQT
jgi:hypothetical protein